MTPITDERLEEYRRTLSDLRKKDRVDARFFRTDVEALLTEIDRLRAIEKAAEKVMAEPKGLQELLTADKELKAALRGKKGKK